MQLHDRLTAVDLRDLTEAEHAALRQGAIAANLSLPEFLGDLVAKTSRRLLNRNVRNGRKLTRTA
jgi:hypothetical protein